MGSLVEGHKLLYYLVTYYKKWLLYNYPSLSLYQNKHFKTISNNFKKSDKRLESIQTEMQKY